MTKTKKVKGYAIVSDRGSLITDISLDRDCVWGYTAQQKSKAQKVSRTHNKLTGEHSRVIPCTITYTLPTRGKKGAK